MPFSCMYVYIYRITEWLNLERTTSGVTIHTKCMYVQIYIKNLCALLSIYAIITSPLFKVFGQKSFAPILNLLMPSKTNFLGKHMKGLTLKTEIVPQNNTTFPLGSLFRSYCNNLHCHYRSDKTGKKRRSVLAGQQII